MHNVQITNFYSLLWVNQWLPKLFRLFLTSASLKSCCPHLLRFFKSVNTYSYVKSLKITLTFTTNRMLLFIFKYLFLRIVIFALFNRLISMFRLVGENSDRFWIIQGFCVTYKTITAVNHYLINNHQSLNIF